MANYPYRQTLIIITVREAAICQLKAMVTTHLFKKKQVSVTLINCQWVS